MPSDHVVRTNKVENALALRLQMHAAQVPVELPDKPRDLGTQGRYSAVAAFEVIQVDSPAPKFHESSPASTEVQRKTKRGN
jgi:hypothetical protein